MTERDWTFELLRFLQPKYVAFCESRGVVMTAPTLRIAPPPAQEEACRFLRGLDEDLFTVSAHGRIESALLLPDNEVETMAACDLFSVDAARVWRERIVQFAAASMLILERGWPAAQVKVSRNPGATRATLDLRVQSPAGETFIAVQVKRTVPELSKLARDLRQCCRRGAHPLSECGFPQNHLTYEYCALNKPPYLLAVAPAGELCMRLSYAGDAIEVEELPSLPPRSVMELQFRRAASA